MNKAKQERLEKAGWKVGTISDFLGLTKEEEAFVEMKVSLSQYLHEKRIASQITQTEMANRIKSSQSRVAKMEKADDSVSLDLIVRSLISLGAGPTEIARCISPSRGPGGRGRVASKRPIRSTRRIGRKLTEAK